MYRTFYAIDLLHTYFSDLKSRGARIVPTEDCVRALQRHRLMFREVGHRAYVLGWLDEQTKKPTITIDPRTVFRFYVVASEMSFRQFTSLPFDPAKSQALYLSNLSSQSANGRLYLSTANPTFNASTSYTLGDLSRRGTELFECVRSHAGGAGNVITDKTHWKDRGEVRSSSSDDVLEFGGGVRTLQLPEAVEDTTLKVFGLNRATNKFTSPLLTKALEFSPATSTVQVPLWKFPAGKYLAKAGGAERYFYHDPAFRPGSILGVIEIFNHLPADDPHSLLDATGSAKGTIFSVVFLNRIALWKYIARTANVLKVKDQSGKYEFESAGARMFRSKTPIPLTEAAYDKIAIEYKAGSTKTTYTKIKNPTAANMKTLEVDSDRLPCAEIYLNY